MPTRIARPARRAGLAVRPHARRGRGPALRDAVSTSRWLDSGVDYVQVFRMLGAEEMTVLRTASLCTPEAMTAP